MASTEVQTLRRKSTENVTVLINVNLALRKPETEPICPILRASLDDHTCVLKDGRIWELFFHLFCNLKSFIAVFKGSQFLQLLHVSSQAKALLAYKMSASTAFKAQIYLHAVAMMSREAQRKNLEIVWDAMNITMVGMAVQLVRKAWNALTKSCLLKSSRVLKQLCQWFIPA